MANGRGGAGGGGVSVKIGDVIIQGSVDTQNIGQIARELQRSIKDGTMEGISLAKTINREGAARSSEAY